MNRDLIDFYEERDSFKVIFRNTSVAENSQTGAQTGAQVPLSQPLKLTSEMLQNQLIEEMLNANIGIDVGSGYSKQGYMKER